MMDFIMVPAILGIITWGIYSIFELFARRKERMALIEKLGNGSLQGNVRLGAIEFSSRFSALKWGGLLLGIGLGLLVGFMIGNNYIPYDKFIQGGDISAVDFRRTRDLMAVIYGSSCLLGGGLGLVAAFLIEFKLSKKSNE